MREFVERINTAAPRERIWAVMADLEQWPEWTESVSRISTLEWATTGVGSRFLVEQPRLKPAEFTTTEWSPGSGFTWESKAPGIRSIASHRIEPAGDGCEVVLVLRFEGWLSWPVALVAGGLVRRYMRMEAAGLKARAEAG
jgi:uncharacterized membrane protein